MDIHRVAEKSFPSIREGSSVSLPLGFRGSSYPKRSQLPFVGARYGERSRARSQNPRYSTTNCLVTVTLDPASGITGVAVQGHCQIE